MSVRFYIDFTNVFCVNSPLEILVVICTVSSVNNYSLSFLGEQGFILEKFTSKLNLCSLFNKIKTWTCVVGLKLLSRFINFLFFFKQTILNHKQSQINHPSRRLSHLSNAPLIWEPSSQQQTSEHKTPVRVSSPHKDIKQIEFAKEKLKDMHFFINLFSDLDSYIFTRRTRKVPGRF